MVTWGVQRCGGDSSAVQDQLRGVQHIQATFGAFAASLADGSVVTWGDQRFGGDSSTVQDQLRGVQQIQATPHAFAAILADGSVVTWGVQRCGGDSSAVQDQLRGVQQIQAAGRAFARVRADGSVAGAFAAILADGSVVTWGDEGCGGDSSAVQDQLRGVQQYHEVEQERFQRAATRAVMLRSACLPWGRALEAYKLFINSIISFGWIAQFPTQATVKKFLRLFGHSVGFSARQASLHLRQVVYGAKFDISSIALQRLWARATKLFHLGHLSWTKAFGSSIWILRKRLQDLGWQELRPFSWTCHLGTISVNTPSEGIGEALHLIRCSWREKQFEKWLHQKRREPDAANSH